MAALSLLLLAAPCARALSSEEACPSWCASFECDGSSWCAEGQRPTPCHPCPRVGIASSVRWELTIPPYVGAESISQAERKCKEHGGRLASAWSEQSNQKLLDMVLKYKRDRAIIGAKREAGGWAWQGREQKWQYENWAPGQPDNSFEGCAEIWTTGGWNDLPCDSFGGKPYLCSVRVPGEDYSFPCSDGMTRKLGRRTKCRYVVSANSPAEKKDIYWAVAKERCIAQGGLLAEPRTAEQVQFLASGTEREQGRGKGRGRAKRVGRRR